MESVDWALKRFRGMVEPNLVLKFLAHSQNLLERFFRGLDGSGKFQTRRESRLEFPQPASHSAINFKTKFSSLTLGFEEVM